MDIFMRIMEGITQSGAHKFLLVLALAMIMVGLFRIFGLRLAQIGKSALSALGLVGLVVLLMCVMPVSKAAQWLAQSIPYVGDLMDYGSIVTLIEENPWAALINFVDCYLLMALSQLLSKPFSGIKNLGAKALNGVVIMLVCIFMLEWVKEQPLYIKMEKVIYALSGSLLIFAVAGLIFAMRWGEGILPPIMSFMPDFLVGPLYTTADYVMILVFLDISGFDLRGMAQDALRIGGAFAPSVIVIAALSTLLLGVFR